MVSWVQKLGFGLQPSKVATANQHLQDNIAAIVEENLKGQCTPGHSCKNQSRVELQRILGGEVEEGDREKNK